MNKRKKILPLLGLGLILYISLVLMVIFINPEKDINIAMIKISPVLIFFVVFLLATLASSFFVLTTIRRSLIFSSLLLSLLVLKYFDLINILYVFILVLIAFLIEVMFWKKN